MSALVETIANQAVFQLQFGTRDAVRYVQRNAGVDETTARDAVRSVVAYYK